MPTVRTRAAKGSDLTPTEADSNFKKTVRQVTTTAATLISDNRGVVEGNHASTPFTITLLAVATAAAAEPGDYSVTISNIGAAAVTVDANSTETINGSTDTLTLAQYSSVRLEVDSAGTGWQITARTGDLGAVTTGAITGSGLASFTNTDDVDLVGVSGSVVVGGDGTGQHIAIDGNEVMSKSDATTAGTLEIQTQGGTVNFGSTTALTAFTIDATAISGTAILDEDNMSSDSATKLATQQSIKAYADSLAVTIYHGRVGNTTGTGSVSGASGGGFTYSWSSNVCTITHSLGSADHTISITSYLSANTPHVSATSTNSFAATFTGGASAFSFVLIVD